MAKLMRLDEAIKKKIVRNSDKIDPNALFLRKKKKVILRKDDTGMEEIQKIHRQNFDYTFFKVREKGRRDQQLLMVAVGTSENRGAEVFLRGTVGHTNSYNVFYKINKLYSNTLNGISVITPVYREEILKLIFERNKSFKGFTFGTWLHAINYELKYPGYQYIQKYIRGDKIMNTILCDSHGKAYSACFDYCPIVEIDRPYSIYVVLNSKKKTGKWKLIPKRNLLLRLRYGLF